MTLTQFILLPIAAILAMMGLAGFLMQRAARPLVRPQQKVSILEKPTCQHQTVTDVTTVFGEIVARLCLNPDCSAQLPADFRLKDPGPRTLADLFAEMHGKIAAEYARMESWEREQEMSRIRAQVEEIIEKQRGSWKIKDWVEEAERRAIERNTAQARAYAAAIRGWARQQIQARKTDP
jgi:hypothetical protein